MNIIIEVVDVIALAAIAVILAALLIALKSGFSEMIKGLEAHLQAIGQALNLVLRHAARRRQRRRRLHTGSLGR